MRFWIAALVCLTVVTQSVHAVDVKLGLNGVDIDAGAAGSLVIGYPRLSKGDKRTAPTKNTVGDKSAMFEYPNGTQIRLELRDGGLMQLSVLNAKGHNDSLRMDMTVSGSMKGKLKWSAN